MNLETRVLKPDETIVLKDPNDKIFGEIVTRHYADGNVQCGGWFMLPKVSA